MGGGKLKPMKTFRSAFAALAASAALAIAAPACAQGKPIDNTGAPWTHRATGTILPAQAGPFSRVSLRQFDAAGRDASAGYRLVNGDGMLIVSVYIYPVIEGWTCAETFADARSYIDAYDGEQVLEERAAQSVLGTDAESHYIRYFLPAGSAARDLPDLVSDLYLTCPAGNEWLVKYRASWSGSRETFPSLDPLFDRIAWPVSLTGG